MTRILVGLPIVAAIAVALFSPVWVASLLGYPTTYGLVVYPVVGVSGLIGVLAWNVGDGLLGGDS